MTHVFSPDFLRAKFAAGLPYEQYVASGKPNEQDHWKSFHARAHLTTTQRDLIASFSRTINILCISGTWCGDCVQQVPFLDAIQLANPNRVHLRLVDRDQHQDLAEPLKICAGNRVPVSLILNEDFDFLALLGDRTLSRYRALAARQLGPSCPLPGAAKPADEIAAELADHVAEVERCHLMLRLSAKMRQRHGD